MYLAPSSVMPVLHRFKWSRVVLCSSPWKMQGIIRLTDWLYDTSRCVSDLFTWSILVRDLAVSGSVAVILFLCKDKLTRVVYIILKTSSFTRSQRAPESERLFHERSRCVSESLTVKHFPLYWSLGQVMYSMLWESVSGSVTVIQFSSNDQSSMCQLKTFKDAHEILGLLRLINQIPTMYSVSFETWRWVSE